MKNVKVILIIFILLFSSIILFNKVSSAYFTYESSVNGSIKTIEDTGGVVTPGGDPEDSYSGLTRNFMSRADITKDHVKTIKFSNVLTKATSGWTTKVVDVSERYDGKVKMKYTPNKDNDDFYDVEISQNGVVSLNTGNADWMFSRFENLEEIDFDNFKGESISSMAYMFENSSVLKKINFRNFNSSNVSNMRYAFNNCYGLETLDLSSFDTSKVTDMSGLFSGDDYLYKLDISNFNFDKVASNTYLFVSSPGGGVLELTVILSNDIKTFNKQKAFISNKLPDGARIVRKNN